MSNKLFLIFEILLALFVLYLLVTNIIAGAWVLVFINVLTLLLIGYAVDRILSRDRV